MNVDEIRDYLSQIDWERHFDKATLRRANAYFQEKRLKRLRFEVSRRGSGRLCGLVRGSGDTTYEAVIEFRPQRGGFLIVGGCDCPVNGACKHQALVLLHAQTSTPDEWPENVPAPPPPPAPPPSSDQLDALPPWLRKAVSAQMAASSASTLDAWDAWFSYLSRTHASANTQKQADDTDGERRFGLILRAVDDVLAVQPAFLRRGRGKAGGWVDPKSLELQATGPVPAPPGGWADEDAIALASLLSSVPSYSRKNAPIAIVSAHLEAALAQLLPRHPVYWERGSVPLELGPELPMRLHWEAQPDGSQRLCAHVESPDEQPAHLLRAHGLWYVQPVMQRYGRVQGDAWLMDFVQSAPQLQPEDVHAVQERFQKLPALQVAKPSPRRLRSVRTTPVPVLRMSVVTVNPWGRNTQRPPLHFGVGDLLFDYDGHTFDRLATSKSSRVAQGNEVLEIERDVEWERKTIQQLRKLDVSNVTDFHYQFQLALNQFLLNPDAHKLPLPPEAWTLVLSELAASGFRIEYSRDFPRDDVVEIDDWHAEISESGGAWFDVSLGIDVEGQRIDLLPILRHLLADPDFPMRKPDDEPDDAAWRVRIDDNRSVRLPMARLRAMLDPLLEWLASGENGLRLHRTQADTLRRISESTLLPWRGADRLRSHLDKLQRAAIPADTPAGFRAELRPYQRDGLAWLNFLSDAGLGGVLADDMGLGKTVQVLAHLVSEKARGKLDLPALVVAPTSLVGNWRDEAARFAPDLDVLILHGADRAERYDTIPGADLVITTYPLLPRDRDALCKQQFSLLVMDEAQAIKNARSQAAQVVREIPAQRRLAMTGTPLENHLGELWAQFDVVEPGLLGSENSFTRTYRTPIEKHGDSDRQQRLNRRVAALLLRRRKEDVLTELPPKTEIIHSLELSGSQRQLYETIRLAQHERVREAIAQRGLAQSGIVVIDALLKLRQACCDPRLVKLDAARKVGESAKLDALLELLDGLCEEGRRVLVFSQFTQMLSLIEQALDARGARYLTLTGDTPSASRNDLVRRFQNGDVPIFLISLKAGGVGLNLTAADTVIHYDPWWNPAVESQATDRAHRMGQDKPVFVYKLICAGTVEEKIQAMQERKADLARAVLEGGSTKALRFDEADLAELFGPAA